MCCNVRNVIFNLVIINNWELLNCYFYVHHTKVHITYVFKCLKYTNEVIHFHNDIILSYDVQKYWLRFIVIIFILLPLYWKNVIWQNNPNSIQQFLSKVSFVKFYRNIFRKNNVPRHSRKGKQNIPKWHYSIFV